MMSGACPPPAPSVWYAWIDRPPIARSVSSTKPASFSVSVWIATCTPEASATRRQASIAAGVVPQSSCSLKPPAPPRSCSHIDSSRTVLPLPSSSTLTGHGSIASSIRARCQAFGVTVVALVPSAGPVPPPMIVVMPLASAVVQDLRADQVDVAVDPAGGEDLAVAGDDLGPRPDHQVRVHAVHGVRVAGLAERHDPAVPDADVGLDDAPVVEHDRAGDHQCPARPRRGWRSDWPIDSRITLPPPKTASSPAAGPPAVLLDLDQQVGVGQPDPVAGRRAVERRRTARRSTWCSSRSDRSVADRAVRRTRPRRPGRPGRRPAGPASTSAAMPGSKRTAVPAGTASRCPQAAARSNSQRRGSPRRSGSASRPAPGGRRCW